jgi:hypothetical protein
MPEDDRGARKRSEGERAEARKRPEDDREARKRSEGERAEARKRPEDDRGARKRSEGERAEARKRPEDDREVRKRPEDDRKARKRPEAGRAEAREREASWEGRHVRDRRVQVRLGARKEERLGRPSGPEEAGLGPDYTIPRKGRPWKTTATPSSPSLTSTSIGPPTTDPESKIKVSIFQLYAIRQK